MLDELVASDGLDHTVGPNPPPGPASFVQHLTLLFATFGEFRADVEGLIAEDDTVVVYWMAHGTHEGRIWGIPPTGRRFAVPAISRLRIKDGKIAEYRVLPDIYGFQQQVGAVPTLATETR